jgi:hypothetical protein
MISVVSPLIALVSSCFFFQVLVMIITILHRAGFTRMQIIHIESFVCE